MILGVIADDFTGATDVASMLVRAGMPTVQVLGVPEGDLPATDAVVIALKTRTIPAAEAVAQSLAALRALQAAGARQIYFKYCSTFDSTPAGNIGPVTDALMQALGTDFTIACPAFPENGRTVFRGHLFVGDQLLSDSGMKNHPLTPMTDANLVRVLQAQTAQRVDLLRVDALRHNAQTAIEQLQADGVRIAVADAIDNSDLLTLAEACAEMPLITAGSGVALGLPPAYQRRGWWAPSEGAASLSAVGGPAAVLSGSCSDATNAQVARWLADGRTAIAIDPLALHQGSQSAASLLAQALPALGASAGGPLLIYATAAPERVKAVQAELGVAAAGALVERTLAELAQALVQAGVRRLVVAGGETSGAVVQALGVPQLRIGAAICPGVPWTEATLPGSGEPLWLALKSGNFGGVDFFADALRQAGVALP
jgi:uncharacterized protein YgbK (DUF1537 family)